MATLIANDGYTGVGRPAKPKIPVPFWVENAVAATDWQSPPESARASGSAFILGAAYGVRGRNALGAKTILTLKRGQQLRLSWSGLAVGVSQH